MPRPPRPSARLNPPLPSSSPRLVESEVLGTSDGSANQHFTLAHPGLILRPTGAAQPTSPDVVLLTQLGANIASWNLQESLAFSRAGQLDYVIEIDENDEATVIFGDGSFGAIPAAGSQIQATPGIDDFGNLRFLLQVDLRIAGDAQIYLQEETEITKVVDPWGGLNLRTGRRDGSEAAVSKDHRGFVVFVDFDDVIELAGPAERQALLQVP